MAAHDVASARGLGRRPDPSSHTRNRLSHGGQGESLVPPYKRGNVSLPQGGQGQSLVLRHLLDVVSMIHRAQAAGRAELVPAHREADGRAACDVLRGGSAAAGGEPARRRGAARRPQARQPARAQRRPRMVRLGGGDYSIILATTSSTTFYTAQSYSPRHPPQFRHLILLATSSTTL